MASGLSSKNKLHLSWSDNAFLPWLNPETVLDYFCNPNNPFYSSECNNQLLKMQGIQNARPEQLSSMIGFEYQLFNSQPPLYVIRKVQRTSAKEVMPISYYYILHGTVYQAPDLLSMISSRLQMTSYYLEEAMESAFSQYVYNPSRGYHWNFNQIEETKKETHPQKFTEFQRERVGMLLQDFVNRFPPNQARADTDMNEETNVVTKEDQPAEKKMKLNQ